mmetsp:Transcript_5225/g.11420  ORF Transcript_5225/g.11420 Transcript_5225/m.11420 type:complete len:268 (+) Transcript_5225:147-950(+)
MPPEYWRWFAAIPHRDITIMLLLLLLLLLFVRPLARHEQLRSAGRAPIEVERTRPGHEGSVHTIVIDRVERLHPRVGLVVHELGAEVITEVGISGRQITMRTIIVTVHDDTTDLLLDVFVEGALILLQSEFALFLLSCLVGDVRSLTCSRLRSRSIRSRGGTIGCSAIATKVTLEPVKVEFIVLLRLLRPVRIHSAAATITASITGGNDGLGHGGGTSRGHNKLRGHVVLGIDTGGGLGLGGSRGLKLREHGWIDAELSGHLWSNAQ